MQRRLQVRAGNSRAAAVVRVGMLGSRLALFGSLLAGCAPAVSSRAPSPVQAIAMPAPSVGAPTRTVSRSAPDPVLDQAIVDALRPEARLTPASANQPEQDGPLPALVREPAPPSAIEPGADPDARLPPESIQRVVRTSSGRFRACYQRALVRDHEARGDVVTFFVIGADGRVELASEDHATLEDRSARQCVQRAFFDLHFPKPPGGRAITVLYPMRFGHGEEPPAQMPSARRAAEAPPPGFAERMRSGIPVEPDPIVMPFEDAPPPRVPSRCASGDPMCSEL